MKNEELRMKNYRLSRVLPNVSAAFLLCISSFFVAGCATHIRCNESARLMQRADFDAAKTAAPEWCRDALKTINNLELELERR